MFSVIQLKNETVENLMKIVQQGFFRRTVNEDSQHPVVCVSGGNCLISNSNNRVACKACRFARCKAVGMTLAGRHYR